MSPTLDLLSDVNADFGVNEQWETVFTRHGAAVPYDDIPLLLLPNPAGPEAAAESLHCMIGTHARLHLGPYGYQASCMCLIAYYAEKDSNSHAVIGNNPAWRLHIRVHNSRYQSRMLQKLARARLTTA